jgi:tetratricopeptide (TPR) repeat protein
VAPAPPVPPPPAVAPPVVAPPAVQPTAVAQPAPEPSPAPERAPEPSPVPVAAEPAPADDTAAIKAHCREVAAGATARYGALVKACQPAAAADPKDVDILLVLARAEADHGGSVKALDWAERAISLDPTLPDAYLYAGTAHQAAGHNKDARAAYQKYIELAPTGRYAADLRAVLKSL